MSVPCVMTMPSTASEAASSFTRLPSFSQTSGVMAWLPIWTICSPLTAAISWISGTAWSSSSTGTLPDV